MSSDIMSAGRYVVEVSQHIDTGSSWTVRTYEKRLFRRKLVSSDWFLDRLQAKRFADQLVKELLRGLPIDEVRKRRPGWNLTHVA